MHQTFFLFSYSLNIADVSWLTLKPFSFRKRNKGRCWSVLGENGCCGSITGCDEHFLSCWILIFNKYGVTLSSRVTPLSPTSYHQLTSKRLFGYCSSHQIPKRSLWKELSRRQRKTRYWRPWKDTYEKVTFQTQKKKWNLTRRCSTSSRYRIKSSYSRMEK